MGVQRLFVLILLACHLFYQPAVLLGWQRGVLFPSSTLFPPASHQVWGVYWNQLIQACKNQLLNIQEFCELAVKQSHH